MNEDIKILEELKEEYSKGLERLNDKDLSLCMQNIYTLRKKQVQAIENLINRNKELEEENRIFALEGKNIQLELHIKNNYIPKSVIREKIEELDDLIIETQKELGSASKEFTIYVYQKSILQDLLKENKEKE